MKSLIIKPKELSVASDISFKCKQRNKKIVDISIISYENEFTKVIKRKLMFDALNFNKKYKLESNKFLSSFWLIIKKICYETKIM
jgi:hypothetical protein